MNDDFLCGQCDTWHPLDDSLELEFGRVCRDCYQEMLHKQIGFSEESGLVECERCFEILKRDEACWSRQDEPYCEECFNIVSAERGDDE